MKRSLLYKACSIFAVLSLLFLFFQQDGRLFSAEVSEEITCQEIRVEEEREFEFHVLGFGHGYFTSLSLNQPSFDITQNISSHSSTGTFYNYIYLFLQVFRL